MKNNQFLCWISSRTSPYRLIIVSMVSCFDLCVAPVSSLYSTENFGMQWAAVIIQFWWIRVAPHVFPAPPFPKRIIANLRMIIKLAGWISRKFQNSQFLIIVAISEWKSLIRERFSNFLFFQKYPEIQPKYAFDEFSSKSSF